MDVVVDQVVVVGASVELGLGPGGGAGPGAGPGAVVVLLVVLDPPPQPYKENATPAAVKGSKPSTSRTMMGFCPLYF